VEQAGGKETSSEDRNSEQQGQGQAQEQEQEEDLRSEDTTSLKNFRVNEIGKRRRFLKEIIISHSLWQEGRFWEQALWQCVLEQVPLLLPHPSLSSSLIPLSSDLSVCRVCVCCMCVA
jgi:hypothetical protein